MAVARSGLWAPDRTEYRNSFFLGGGGGGALIWRGRLLQILSLRRGAYLKLGANSSICGIQNSHQNRSKNKLVREKTVTRAHGSCSLRVMGSWIRLLPQKQLEDFYIKVILPSVTYGLTVWGSCNKTHLNNLEKLRARAGRIVYGLPWDTSAEDVLMPTGWDTLETMYKLRLTEFVFKC